jgi:transposase
MEVTMPMLTIRNDLTAEELRRLARRERDARVGRRMLAIANALDGMSRATAAKLAGMDRQTLRDWVIRYNKCGVPGLGDRWGAGRPTAVDDGQLAVVKAAILQAASRAGDAKPALRIVDVAALIEERTGVSYSISGAHRLMQTMGLSYQKTRPSHPKADPKARERFKKSPSRAEADRA